MISNKTISYIIEFLTGINCYDLEGGISYTNEIEKSRGNLIIIPSEFFNKDVYLTIHTLPQIPLEKINDIPILFGSNEIKRKDGKIIIYADIIASTFFLITRYEEIIRKNVRDKYGRFPGRESILAKAGYINRPIVDEYGILLKKLLYEVGFKTTIKMNKNSKIILTHDVDHPWEEFNIFSSIKRIIKSIIKDKKLCLYPLYNLFGFITKDPIYTFPWLIKQDNIVREKYKERCEIIYFLKSSSSNYPEDGFNYIYNKNVVNLIDLLKKNKIRIGLHPSLAAGKNPELIISEIKILEEIVGEKITYSRNHYLCSCEPEDMKYLIKAGVTDDFTMGYADIAGFRLGTSKKTRWIDPINCELTDLWLHPLTIMEGSLFAHHYMNMDFENAYSYSKELISNTLKNEGDVCLLWHNDRIDTIKGNNVTELYLKLIQFI